MKNEKLCPRFVKEYAAYVIRRAKSTKNAAIGEYIRRVNRYVWECEHGYITPEEALRVIMEAILYHVV